MTDTTPTEEIIQTQTLDLAPIRAYDAQVHKVLNEYVTHHVKGEPVYGFSIDGPTDGNGLVEAKVARRTIKTLRLAIETTRKDLKKPALDWGNAVDAEAKRLTDLVIQAESPIDASIKAVEAEKREIKAAVLAERRDLIDARFRSLLAVGSSISLATIEELDDDDYLAVLAQETAGHEEREAERKRVANVAARVADAAAKKAERERTEAEADAAKTRAEDTERAEKERARVAKENQIRQDKADAKAERERADREKAEKELAVAKAERDKLQAAADEIARVEREEEERCAKEIADMKEASRIEKARPVVERIQEFAENVRIDIIVPDIGFGLREEFVAILSTAADSIEELALRYEAGTYTGE